MPPTRERMDQYNHRRQTRLASRANLRHAPAGQSLAWYVTGELLAVDEDRRHVERYLGGQRDARVAGDEEIMPGLRRYHLTGLDIPTTVRAIHGTVPAGRQVVSPNHVFMSSPFNHGGPFGPPTAADAAAFAAPVADNPVPVTIVDTGFWPDTVLPGGYLCPGGVELEQDTDVDSDGLLDGDVGHANFVGGVIAQHHHAVTLRVEKVLDTFGVCTEDELVQAIQRIDPTTKVINLSLGGFTPDDNPPLGVRMALAELLSGQDRVLVAAAGNDGNRTNPFWPAAFTSSGDPWSGQVVAVAAHDGTAVCDWSNTGPWVTMAAPGLDILSSFINGTSFFPAGWAVWSGTSFAAPRVAAEVAARISAGADAVAALAQVRDEVLASGKTFGSYPVLP